MPFRLETAEEVLTTLRLEPLVRNIYVEGKSDRGLIRRFLEKIESVGVEVYPVETVILSGGSPRGTFNLSGNRASVVALCDYFSKTGINLRAQLAFIIDRDLDSLLQMEPKFDLLLITDYCSLEGYYFGDHNFDTLLSSYTDYSAAERLESIASLKEVCARLFCLRASMAQESRPRGIPSAHRYCSLRSKIDSDLLAKDVTGGDKALLERTTRYIDENISKTAIGDPRLYMHRDDVASVLAGWLAAGCKQGAAEDLGQATILVALRISCKVDELTKETMFSELKRRFKP